MRAHVLHRLLNWSGSLKAVRHARSCARPRTATAIRSQAARRLRLGQRAEPSKVGGTCDRHGNNVFCLCSARCSCGAQRKVCVVRRGQSPPPRRRCRTRSSIGALRTTTFTPSAKSPAGTRRRGRTRSFLAVSSRSIYTTPANTKGTATATPSIRWCGGTRP